MKIHIENAFSPVPKRLSLIFAFWCLLYPLTAKSQDAPRRPSMTAPVPTLRPTLPPTTAPAPHVPPVAALPGRNETFKQLADVNGDGLMDSCSFVSAALSCDLDLRSGGFSIEKRFQSTQGIDERDPDQPSALVDVNRDGRADFCRYTSAEPNERLYVIWIVCAKKR
jgi:hypothetical protein